MQWTNGKVVKGILAILDIMVPRKLATIMVILLHSKTQERHSGRHMCYQVEVSLTLMEVSMPLIEVEAILMPILMEVIKIFTTVHKRSLPPSRELQTVPRIQICHSEFLTLEDDS